MFLIEGEIVGMLVRVAEIVPRAIHTISSDSVGSSSFINGLFIVRQRTLTYLLQRDLNMISAIYQNISA